MKIIVVGCGNIGYAVIDLLCREGHDVVAVDTRQDRLKNANAEFDIMCVGGDGADRDVLEAAGVSDADLLLALTETDERNLMICLIGKKCGAKHTIARVRNPLYDKQIHLMQEELGLSLVVNPEYAAAVAITRLLKLPSAIETEVFARGKIELSKFKLEKDNILCDTSLKEISSKVHCDVLIPIVERGNDVIIPTGDFVLRAGDKISVMATPKNIVTFYKGLKLYTKQVESVMIIGGSSTAIYLAKQLTAIGIRVKIVDRDRSCCEDLCEKLPNVYVANGDATDRSTMIEEGLMDTQGVICLTEMDEQNIMLALYAKQINPKAKVITRIHRMNYDDMISGWDLGSNVYPRKTVAEDVVRYVRAMSNSMESSNVETLHRLVDGRVEALEFNIHEESRAVGVPFAQLDTRDNLLIGAINRNGRIIIPGGTDEIMIGDTVIVITTDPGLLSIDDILR